MSTATRSIGSRRHVARVMQRLKSALGTMTEPAVEKIAEEEAARQLAKEKQEVAPLY